MKTINYLGRSILAPVLILLLALVVIHPGLFAGKIYSSSDAQSAETFKHLGDLAKAQGEYPLWNPYVFAGMPSYASLAYTPDIYPLSRPIRDAVALMNLPPMSWLLVHLLLTGIFTYGYLRWRGNTRLGSLLGGILVLAIPNLVAWSAYGHGTKVGSFAWLPLALWCTEGIFRRGRPIYFFGLAVALSMQLLRSHPQIAYYTVIAIAFWAAFLGLPDLRSPGKRKVVLGKFAALALAGILALGSSLILYLPVMEYQGYSIRGAQSQGGGAAYDYATDWSLPASELDTLWWPTAAGYGKGSYVGGLPFTDYPNYIGAPLLLLALAGLIFRRSRWTWALAALALFATLVALGRHGPIYPLLYDYLPAFKKFRVPVMILILQEFAVIALAVTGAEELFRRSRRAAATGGMSCGYRILIPVLIALGVVLLVLGTVAFGGLKQNLFSVWQSMKPGMPVSVLVPVADMARLDILRISFIFLTAGALLLALRRPRFPVQAAMIILGVMLFADLVAVDMPMMHPQDSLQVLTRQGDRIVGVSAPAILREHSVVQEYVAGNALTDFLREQGDRPRIWPLGNKWAQSNLFAGQEIVSLAGYHAAKLKIYEDIRASIYTGRPAVRWVNLLAAGYVASPAPLQESTLVGLKQLGMDLGDAPLFEHADGIVYRNHSAHPRAWLVGSYELEAAGKNTSGQLPPADVFQRVMDPAFDPKGKAILSAAPDLQLDGEAVNGMIQLEEEGSDWMTFQVRSDHPSLLITSEIHYPGWKVEVDGEEQPLLRADYALRAVALEAGEHEVSFRFASDSFRRGRWISWITGAILLLGLLWGAWKEFKDHRHLEEMSA